MQFTLITTVISHIVRTLGSCPGSRVVAASCEHSVSLCAHRAMELPLLGDDVCSLICSKLDIVSLASLAQTSRRFAALIRREPKIWRGIARSPVPLPLDPNAREVREASSACSCLLSRSTNYRRVYARHAELPMAVLQRCASSTAGSCLPKKPCASKRSSSNGRSCCRSRTGTSMSQTEHDVAVFSTSDVLIRCRWPYRRWIDAFALAAAGEIEGAAHMLASARTDPCRTMPSFAALPWVLVAHLAHFL